MTRLTLRLSQRHIDAIDSIMRDDDSYPPGDRHRRDAIGGILLDHTQVPRDRRIDHGSDDDRQQLDAVPRKRDDAVAALTAGRRNRRRDRERLAAVRRNLANALKTIERLRDSRQLAPTAARAPRA